MAHAHATKSKKMTFTPSSLKKGYNLNSASQMDGKKIETMSDDRRRWRGKLMPSGNRVSEHHYHVEGWNELKY